MGDKMNQSYWQKTTRKKTEKVLNENITTDIVIIGGGLAGVSLAYQLKDSPYRIVVLEKDTMGSHTSGHTTAKLTVLHGLLYQKITKHYDIHQAYLYYRSNEKALKEIQSIIKKENISCDYQENTSYIYTDDPQYAKDIQEQKKILESLRIDMVEDNQHLASIGLKHQAVFHPLKYLFALIQKCQKSGVQFYEHSQVVHIERKNKSFTLKVNNHTVTCQYLIHATRYPFIRKGIYFMKLFQQREYVDYKETQEGKDSYLCVDQINSYRPLIHQDSLTIHRDAKDWHAQDSIPLRGISYIGRLNQYHQEFIIYGFQKWGMTLSQVAARLISDLILERDNPYESLYSCHYFSISSAKQYTQRIMKNITKGYWNQRFQTKSIQSLDVKEGAIVKIDGHLMAVYKDSQEKLHYFSPYCPHLKCLVHFNKKSQTWDCPCHQSIYDAYGQLMEGPSLFSLNERQK